MPSGSVIASLTLSISSSSLKPRRSQTFNDPSLIGVTAASQLFTKAFERSRVVWYSRPSKTKGRLALRGMAAGFGFCRRPYDQNIKSLTAQRSLGSSFNNPRRTSIIVSDRRSRPTSALYEPCVSFSSMTCSSVISAIGTWPIKSERIVTPSEYRSFVEEPSPRPAGSAMPLSIVSKTVG